MKIVLVELKMVKQDKKENLKDKVSAKAPSLAPMRNILLPEADWRRCGEWGPRGRDCEESHPPAGSLRSTIQLLMSQIEASRLSRTLQAP